MELNGQGQILQAGYAPYLDYRHATQEEINEMLTKADALPWLKQNMEDKIKSFAITTIAKEHLERVKKNRQYLVEKTKNAVQERLTNEIRYWDHRARDLRMQWKKRSIPTQGKRPYPFTFLWVSHENTNLISF